MDPLRLVFVSAARRWTGGERCLVTVARGLATRGHAIAFAFDPRGPLASRLGPGVRPAPVRILNDVDPLALLRLRALIGAHRADAVCVNTFRELKVGGLAARLAGHARVVNRMGAADALYGGRRERIIYRALLDVLVRDSDWACRRVRRENPWFRRPVLRARNGVDAEAVAAVRPAGRSELGAREGETLIAVMGRARADAADLVARAALSAARAMASTTSGPSLPAPVLHLAFIGEADPRVSADVERLLPAGERVRASFLGFRNERDALALLAACDLLLRPARADGISFTVLEAMALGLPVVASADGGLPEVVADGETGRLVAPGDAASLAEALRSLATDPELRRRMGDAGRRRVAREFTEERMLDEYETAFRRAARRPPLIQAAEGPSSAEPARPR